MSITLKSGETADVGTVDPVAKALRTSSRPIEIGSGGSYRVALRSGTIAAQLAANGLIYSFRWGDATLLAVIHRIRAQLFANIAFTAAFNDMSLRAYITRSYTASDSSGGGSPTAATLTGNNGKKRTSHATSKIATNGDLRILGTAVISGGSGTDDTDPFLHSQVGKPNVVNVAAGTEYLAPQPIVTMEYEPDIGDGVYPHVFAQNEGFRIRNGPVIWPAAGTGILVVTVDWSEVPLTALTS